jgi:hypothetical protein
MLTTPALPAIQHNTTTITQKNHPLNTPDIDPEELKKAILERIEELLQKDITFINQLILDPSDPDGPYKGGLDDLTDFKYLFWGLLDTGWLVFAFKIGFFQEENLLMLIYNLLLGAGMGLTALLHFGEAFDVIDADRDGC